MFPKLLKKATLEDVQKENPTLYDSMKDVLSAEIAEEVSATLQVTHTAELAVVTAQVAELTTKLNAATTCNNILNKGIVAKQSELAIKLIAEGKSEADAIVAIDAAKQSLESFSASAPAPAGSGSASDAQEIDTKEKAIESTMKSNKDISHAKAISMARRQYPSLFVSPHLLNIEKRS
jgi:hypothetical protein